MSTFALHHAELPAFASSWPDEVRAIIDAKLEEEIAPNELRTIVLAPTHDFTRLGVWLGVEWESYPYAEDVSSAAGFVSLAPWLDGVDAVALGQRTLTSSGWRPRRTVRFADAKRDESFGAWWRALHDGLVATAIRLATQALADRFKQPVGVFVSLSGAEARLTAFCHPQGAPLWPVQEHRAEHGYGSAYPAASTAGDRLTIFYPEGEGDDSGPPSIRQWTPSDVETARYDDDDREVYVRFAGDANDVRFSGGHTNEEMGGPDRAGVIDALVGFFKAHGKVLAKSDAPPPELPADTSALHAALSALAGDRDKAGFVARLAKAHGVARVAPLLETLEAPEKLLGQLHKSLASAALDANAWEDAVTHLRLVPEKDRTKWMQARALVALGRWDEVLAVAADDDEAERALALHGLGRTAEALALTEGKKDSELLAVRALLLARSDPAQASSLIAGALASSPRDYLRVHLEPAFPAAFAEQRALKASIEASQAAIAALPASELDVSAARRLEVDGPVQVLGAPLRGDDEKYEGPSYRETLVRGDTIWSADSTGALVELHPGRDARTVARFASEVGALHELDGGTLVGVGAQLLWLDAAGKTAASAWCPSHDQGPIATRDGLIAYANRDVLGFYRRSGDRLERLGLLAIPRGRHVSAQGFVANDRLLVSSAGHLLLVDVADPATPAVLRRWETDATVLDAWDGNALIASDGTVYLAKVAGDALSFDWGVKTESSPFVVDAGARGRAIITRGAATLLRDGRAERVVLLGTDGYPLEPRAVRFDADGAIAVTNEGAVRLTALEHDPQRIRAAVESTVPRIREWLAAQMETWLGEGLPKTDELPARPLGGLVLQWPSDDWAGLRGQGPCSVVSAGYEAFVQLQLEGAPGESREAGEVSDQLRQQRSALEHARTVLATRARERACLALANEALERFSARTKSTFFFTGLETNGGLVVAGSRAGGGEVGPRRAVIAQPAPKSLEEQLTSSRWYTQVAAWTGRARRDAAFRAEVLEILTRENVRAASRIATAVLPVDPEACERALLAAADRDAEFGFEGLAALTERGVEAARTRLVALIDDAAQPGLALAARLVLGRVDEDGTVPLVQAVLEEDDELPNRTLAALSDERIARLKDVLVAARERTRRDELLVPMTRAGWTPDEKVLQRGNGERGREDDFMAGLFGDDDFQDANARAVRVWTARRIGEALAGDGPLWPADVPIEAKRISWQRFFDAAWPHWERRGLLGRLFEVLPARAAASKPAEGQKHGHDASLAFQALYQALLRGDGRAVDLGRALEGVPYDEKARADLVRMARLARVQFGWSLMKAKRYAEARRVADAAVADGPSDGQVLFFEARLAWLERDDPNAAIARITAVLDKAEDAVGRARLINLHGAALDALGRQAEALPLFHKAFQVNEAAVDDTTGKAADQAMSASILSNIAEAHWKLGQRDDARKFAEQAARRGSGTEIVKEILAETEG